MLKGTQKFQTIMNNYQKHQYRKSNILSGYDKNKVSLNSLFIQELNKVKRFQNFSDDEYMINEIKNENKNKKSNKVFELKEKENNFERGRVVKNEKLTKETFFFYRNKSEFNEELSNKNKLNLKLNDQSSLDNQSHIQQTNSIHDLDFSFTTNNSIKKKFLPLPTIYNQTNFNLLSLMDSIRNDDDLKINNNDDNAKKTIYNKKISIDDNIFPNKNKKMSMSNKILAINDKFNNDLLSTNTALYTKTNTYNDTMSEQIRNMGNNKKNNVTNLFMKYSKINNISNKFNPKFKRSMNFRDKQRTEFLRFRLPLLKHEIMNQINQVAESSKNLEKHINHYSTESDLVFMKEKNKFKIINDSIKN